MHLVTFGYAFFNGQTQGGDGGVIDIEKTTLLLEPENNTEGGLSVPGKDRPVFRPPERRSHLGATIIDMHLYLFSLLN